MATISEPGPVFALRSLAAMIGDASVLVILWSFIHRGGGEFTSRFKSLRVNCFFFMYDLLCMQEYVPM
jgi:hypothetical protein